MRLIDADLLQEQYMALHNGKRSISIDLAWTVYTWVPVARRNPFEGHKWYLVTCIYTEEDGSEIKAVGIAKYSPKEHRWLMFNPNFKVIAWTELPEPYKEED